MITKPKNWYQLPYPMMVALVDRCDLIYDVYESSHDEAVTSVLSNPTYYYENNKIIQSYFDGMSDETFNKFSMDVRERLKSQLLEINNFLGIVDSEDFIEELKKLDGAIDYDGDCSTQVIFKLTNGKTLRIGMTDDDVAKRIGFWCDQYEGLTII